MAGPEDDAPAGPAGPARGTAETGDDAPVGPVGPARGTAEPEDHVPVGPVGWRRRMARYVPAALLVSAAALAPGWTFLGPEGRRGLLVAVGVVLAVQLVSFGLLATRRTGSPGLLVAWGVGTLARFVVIGAAAFLLAGREGVDVAVALLAMAGLFFVLLLMEPWALRERDRKPTDG
jgi:hypothetical protein